VQPIEPLSSGSQIFVSFWCSGDVEEKHRCPRTLNRSSNYSQLQNATLIIRSGFSETQVAKGRNIEMIRLVVATIILTVLIGSVAFAQNSTPKVQVFGGYSYVHVDNGGLAGGDSDLALREVNLPFGTASNFTGWNAEGQYNFNRSIALAADAHYGLQKRQPPRTSQG